MALVAVLGPIGVLVPAGAVAKPGAQEDSSDRTSALEARRVDSVPTPKLAWRACTEPGTEGAQCATVMLPLDYDEPNGAKTQVALLRRPARDQAHRVGTLFVNPGGPAGSATGMARDVPLFLGPALLDRFDVVGVDPRGTNSSEQVRCFTSNEQEAEALEGFNMVPVNKVEERAHIASAKRIGAACSSTGRPLSGSMSAAEVARDMDVLRRAVGDRKLTFLGFSYATYLGQVYANMFPDRVRAVVFDGVFDPVAYAGTPATASRPQYDRIRSADGTSKALLQLLRLCDQAGTQKCRFAAGDPVANFDLMAKRLKKTPLLVPGVPVKFTYANLVSTTLDTLYSSKAYLDLDPMFSDLMILTEPADARSRATKAERSRAMTAFATRLKAQPSTPQDLGFADNFVGAHTSVYCTDGLAPPDASSGQLAVAVAAADRRVKHFGQLWAWKSAPCGRTTWTARDEDAYRGPFNRRTASPILVVGNTWDPATSYQGAVKAASLLPNSRLLSSDNWGHGAYIASRCAASAIDTYLLTQAVPARGTVCHDGEQPFQDKPTAPPSQGQETK